MFRNFPAWFLALAFVRHLTNSYLETLPITLTLYVAGMWNGISPHSATSKFLSCRGGKSVKSISAVCKYSPSLCFRQNLPGANASRLLVLAMLQLLQLLTL